MTTTEDESEFPPERVRSHRDLMVWRKGIDLAAEAHRLAVILPAEEGDPIRERMIQSAIAVPTNIAKGYGPSTRVFVRHLDIARGKLFATKAMFEMGQHLGYFDASMLSKARLLIDEVDRMLCLLIDSLGTRKWE
jgi:four helix bundle protein